MIQTDIHFEITDTFGGDANYSWVKRGKVECEPGENYSDRAAVRRVKKAIGWTGAKCETASDGADGLILRPAGVAQICFITFYPHGSAS